MTTAFSRNGCTLDSANTLQMNYILRHRFRNLCAGMKMSIQRIADQTAATHPDIGEISTVILSEMDKLQTFTERMDLVFDRLPRPRNMTLREVIDESKTRFAERHPACKLQLNGARGTMSVRHGNWLQLAAQELLDNAAEAAGTNGQVKMTWKFRPALEITVANAGAVIPEDIPTAPPRPFYTSRSRHDGLGLAIVRRLCKALKADLEFVHKPSKSVVVRIRFSA